MLLKKETDGGTQAEGYCQSERSYGHFSRNIVLPDGAKPEATKATFKEGVLEIAIDHARTAQTDRSPR